MSTSNSPTPAVYTPQDFESIRRIKKWLNDHNESNAWLGRKASIPNGTLSQILSGKYVSSPTKQIETMLSVLLTEDDRRQDGTPGYVKGSIFFMVQTVCDRTRKHRSMGAISGYVGVGKTSAGREYQSARPLTLLVEANPNMTPGVLMNELLGQLNLAVPSGLDRKFNDVVAGVRGTNYLIIADEAERLSSGALEYLRRIRDKGNVGVVLMGTEKLTALLKRDHGRFDQVRSRIGMWPKTIECITRDDADNIARDALADAGDLSDDTLDALWAYCAGSARLLKEAFVTAIKDYGFCKPGLSGKMVDEVAKKVLFMPVRTVAQGGK
jgi:DNA transposition AAA+ family ATPase